MASYLRVIPGRVHEHAYAPHSAGMLCAHRDRPRSRRAAERGYQLSPSDVDCPCDPPVGVMLMRWRDDTSVGRTRVFNYQDRARLILIQRLRRLGFSIEAIRE